MKIITGLHGISQTFFSFRFVLAKLPASKLPMATSSTRHFGHGHAAFCERLQFGQSGLQMFPSETSGMLRMADVVAPLFTSVPCPKRAV